MSECDERIANLGVVLSNKVTMFDKLQFVGLESTQ